MVFRKLRGVLFIVRAGNDKIKADFMHTKRTTYPIKMKTGIHLEEQLCTEIGTFLLLECSPVRKKTIGLKMQICIERIGENAILVHFHAIVPDIRSSGRTGEHPDHKLQMIFLQCGTMGSCLLNSLSVAQRLLIRWDFCRFF